MLSKNEESFAVILPTISYLTDIYFGVGQLQVLSELLQRSDVRRPLVVTDRGLQDLGFVDRLGISDAAVFSDVNTNPTEANVLAGLQVFREHECDAIVALGGGSPMDCAKCISLLSTHPEPLEQYALIRGGVARISANKPPVMAVPTTAGTGSEVGRAALVTTSSGEKLGVISKFMIPSAAICDPELTRGMPASLTASTGMDAISHCIETFCSPKYNPVADAIALDGLRRGWQNLKLVVEQPDNVTLRSEMMMASLQGALSFQKGLGLIHSLSHPLGALKDKQLHHGTLNSVFLPHVLRFNATACPDKMEGMAQAMGIGGGAGALAEAFERFSADLGLPQSLGAMGVVERDLEGIPAAAVADHSTPSNPRPVTMEDCLAILTDAL